MRLILDALSSSAGRDEDTFCRFLQGHAETHLTYGDLRRESSCYASFLHAEGVRRGDVVLIILPHSPVLFPAFLGAMLLGAVPSFMPPPTSKQDPTLYWHSHEKLFARIGDGVVLTTAAHRQALRARLPALTLRVLVAGDAPGIFDDFPVNVAAPDDIAFLQHSSGTTGLKKGVALSHAAVLRQVASYARTLRLSPHDRIVSWLPLYHDMGLIACFMLPLITGTPVVMLDPFEWVINPRLLFDAIKCHRGTLCWLPNFAFHHLGRTVRAVPELDLSSMRAWIDCSEPCRAETFDGFARKFAGAGVCPDQLQVCYAMAETVFAVTQTPPGRAPRVLSVDPETLRNESRIEVVPANQSRQSILSTGAPIPGLQVRIVNDRGEPLPDGTVGEIAVTGSCLFTGYFKLEEETRRKLRSGWYHTGDLGFLHEGELFVTGRKNDLIIVHGRNYYAHELEFIVNQVPGAHPGRNVAAGWFRPEVGSEDVVVIAEVDGSTVGRRAQFVEDIKQALLAQAGLLVFDVHLVSPGWLVKTTSGKISRSENLQKYLAASAAVAAQAV